MFLVARKAACSLRPLNFSKGFTAVVATLYSEPQLLIFVITVVERCELM